MIDLLLYPAIVTVIASVLARTFWGRAFLGLLFVSFLVVIIVSTIRGLLGSMQWSSIVSLLYLYATTALAGFCLHLRSVLVINRENGVHGAMHRSPHALLQIIYFLLPTFLWFLALSSLVLSYQILLQL